MAVIFPEAGEGGDIEHEDTVEAVAVNVPPGTFTLLGTVTLPLLLLKSTVAPFFGMWLSFTAHVAELPQFIAPEGIWEK